MDNETKERIAKLRTDIGETSAGTAMGGNWRNLFREKISDLIWLLARLDSLILMEEVDFAFYKGRIQDLEADLQRYGSEQELHGYSRGKADAEAETKAVCAILLSWREWYGEDREKECIVCDGHTGPGEEHGFVHEKSCPMLRTRLFLTEV